MSKKSTSTKKFAREIIYKVTFPNKKIYIGLVSSHSTRWPCYFGSVHPYYVEQDFTPDELAHFTLTRDEIWASETAMHSDALKKETELIKEYQSNDPKIGYNRRPKFPGAIYPKGDVIRRKAPA
jgi:hypothetical protein